MSNHYLVLVLFVLCPLFSEGQQADPLHTKVHQALEESRPNEASILLSQLPEEQWLSQHFELQLRIHFQQAQYQEFIKLVKANAVNFELSALAKLQLIKAQIHANQLAEASTGLEEIEESIAPEEFQLAHGLLAYEMEDYEIADQFFTAAIALNPENPMAWVHRGQCLGKRQNYPQAIQAFQFAIDIDRHCGPGYAGLASALVHQQKPDRALKVLIMGIQQNPENLPLLNKGAQLALDLADYESARQLCLQALTIYPKSGELYAQLGLSYFYVQDYEQAQQFLEKATRFRRYGADYYYLGLAAIRNRQMLLAHHSLEVALSLGFEEDDLSQLVDHCRTMLTSFEQNEDNSDFRQF